MHLVGSASSGHIQVNGFFFLLCLIAFVVLCLWIKECKSNAMKVIAIVAILAGMLLFLGGSGVAGVAGLVIGVAIVALARLFRR